MSESQEAPSGVPDTTANPTINAAQSASGAQASASASVVNHNHIEVRVVVERPESRRHAPSRRHASASPSASKGKATPDESPSPTTNYDNPIQINPLNPVLTLPQDIKVAVVNENYVTTVTDNRHGTLVITHNKTTGADAITMTGLDVQLRTNTAKAGFEGYRNENYEYGSERRAFAVREGDQKSWFNQPEIYCQDTPGYDTSNTTNRTVNVATAAEIRNFMSKHPALAEFSKNPRLVSDKLGIEIPDELFRSGAQDLTLKDGHSVNLGEINRSLNPSKKLEVCPANQDSFMQITPLSTGGSKGSRQLSPAVTAVGS